MLNLNHANALSHFISLIPCLSHNLPTLAVSLVIRKQMTKVNGLKKKLSALMTVSMVLIAFIGMTFFSDYMGIGWFSILIVIFLARGMVAIAKDNQIEILMTVPLEFFAFVFLLFSFVTAINAFFEPIPLFSLTGNFPVTAEILARFFVLICSFSGMFILVVCMQETYQLFKNLRLPQSPSNSALSEKEPEQIPAKSATPAPISASHSAPVLPALPSEAPAEQK